MQIKNPGHAAAGGESGNDGREQAAHGAVFFGVVPDASVVCQRDNVRESGLRSANARTFRRDADFGPDDARAALNHTDLELRHVVVADDCRTSAADFATTAVGSVAYQFATADAPRRDADFADDWKHSAVDTPFGNAWAACNPQPLQTDREHCFIATIGRCRSRKEASAVQAATIKPGGARSQGIARRIAAEALEPFRFRLIRTEALILVLTRFLTRTATHFA